MRSEYDQAELLAPPSAGLNSRATLQTPRAQRRARVNSRSARENELHSLMPCKKDAGPSVKSNAPVDTVALPCGLRPVGEHVTQVPATPAGEAHGGAPVTPCARAQPTQRPQSAA